MESTRDVPALHRPTILVRPSPWRRLWRLARRKPLGALGALLLGLMAIAAIGAPVLSPSDPERMERRHRLEAPTGSFLLGTDKFGRDQISRLIHGARISLFVGAVATTLGVGAGSLLGVVSGFLGGRSDMAIQRLMDMLMAFPTLILAMTLVAVLGPSVINVTLAVAVVLTPNANRVVRSTALGVKQNEFVEAARVVGCGTVRILRLHIFPNVMAPIIVLATVALGTAILTESSLSFLGLGPPPPTPTWGSMLSQGRANLEDAPWLAIYPGLAISLAVLAFNLFGDGLRDVLDPRLRGSQ